MKIKHDDTFVSLQFLGRQGSFTRMKVTTFRMATTTTISNHDASIGRVKCSSSSLASVTPSAYQTSGGSHTSCIRVAEVSQSKHSWRHKFLIELINTLLSGVFLLPYFITLFICGIPLLFMELSIGQFTGRGVIGAIGQCCPLFKGLNGICFINLQSRSLLWRQKKSSL